MFRAFTVIMFVAMPMCGCEQTEAAAAPSATAQEEAALLATCKGADPCNACKTCKHCKHCSKNGGTCGACKK